MLSPLPPEIIPTTPKAYAALERPLLRLLRPKGCCIVAGKVIAETEKGYRVVFPVGNRIYQRLYRKNDTAHFAPCRYCA